MLPVIVTVDDLAAGLTGAAPVVVDARLYLDGRSTYDAYVAGHLPGAVHVDLETVAAGPAGADVGRHPLPSPEAFAHGLGQAGIGDDTPVVAYDDSGGVMAARLVWMLRAVGHDAALLDGDVRTWPGGLETGPPTPPTARVMTPRPWPGELLADIDDVAALDHEILLDARPRDRYEGDDASGLDPRVGHIPGARSLPVRDHLDDDGRLLARDALRQRFADAGVDGATPVVSSCGSGVTACHNLLLMEHLGLGRGRLYPGSWSQWSASDRPIVTGPEPA